MQLYPYTYHFLHAFVQPPRAAQLQHLLPYTLAAHIAFSLCHLGIKNIADESSIKARDKQNHMGFFILQAGINTETNLHKDSKEGSFTRMSAKQNS